jgi:hypothetical protein
MHCRPRGRAPTASGATIAGLQAIIGLEAAVGGVRCNRCLLVGFETHEQQQQRKKELGASLWGCLTAADPADRVTTTADRSSSRISFANTIFDWVLVSRGKREPTRALFEFVWPCHSFISIKSSNTSVLLIKAFV